MSIRDRVHPLLENKLRNLQISRISDFEIEIIIQNENHLATESFDR
jgi:hypothetical protein